MTETPQEDKGYIGEDAADLDRPADERDVQTAPGGSEKQAQNVKQDQERAEDDEPLSGFGGVGKQ
jgi:hypothetical protein